jgi:cholesterol transport system auxiliary component
MAIRRAWKARHASRRLFQTGFAAALCLALAACAPLAPEKVDTEWATLDQLPAEIPQGRARAAILLVLPPDAEAPYDTARMAYIEAPHRFGYFGRHEWAAAPAQMLLPLLLRTMEQTHAYAAVLAPPSSSRYGYALQVRVLELVQDFRVDPPLLRLTLHVQIHEGMSNRVLAAREIILRESMRGRTPGAGVEAANRAAASTLRQIADFTLQQAR